MTKEERELQQNIIRVATNIGILLDIGLFPGKHCVSIGEAQGFLKSIVDDASAKISTPTPAPAAPAPEPQPAPAA